MSIPDFVDLCSDDEIGEAAAKVVNKGHGSISCKPNWSEQYKAENAQNHKVAPPIKRQKSDVNRSSNAGKSIERCSRLFDQQRLVVDGSSLPSGSSSEPLYRQFWKAGNYDVGQTTKVVVKNGTSHLRVHPKFLHSNATSHKWALGAIAELLDNAVDEIQNGSTFVIVDKIANPRNGSPALLIQDDGGGMDPECIRRCMSFGFSDKKSKNAIGQYGNGFKTSTMRLGADAIVFSRCMNKRTLTQSVGLLSYTFLRQTGHDVIVVPLVDYEFNPSNGVFGNILRSSEESFSSNLSMLLQWSPYSTEAELLKQFDDIGGHGTKIIVFNLWFNDDGDMELDFESDPEDIMINGAPKIVETGSYPKQLIQKSIANRFRYSLRVYSSILYLRLPANFKIILRGRVVEHHNIADDLKFPEYILYKPQVGGNMEAVVITTIGFIKEAPHVNIHGFNVYHKNRLIMPFWPVVHQTNSRGRGVVGILEANFIEPTHDKQDFEKTSLLQKLELRLRHMTLEYWNCHCELIGYKIPTPAAHPSHQLPYSGGHGTLEPVVLTPNSPAIDSPRVASAPATPSPTSAGRPGQFPRTGSQSEFPVKRKNQSHFTALESLKRPTVRGSNTAEAEHAHEQKPGSDINSEVQDAEAISLLQENKKLHAQCSEYEKREEELRLKVHRLQSELEDVRQEHARLLKESQSMYTIKEEEL